MKLPCFPSFLDFSKAVTSTYRSGPSVTCVPLCHVCTIVHACMSTFYLPGKLKQPGHRTIENAHEPDVQQLGVKRCELESRESNIIDIIVFRI